LHTTATLLATLLIGIPAAWGALALKYQAPGGRALNALCITLWTAFSIASIFALWQGRFAIALPGFALAFGGLLLWWHRLTPSNDRSWADDVAQIANGSIEGNRVTLYNVRAFDWRTETDYTQRWETRHYDLERLHSVDMIMSYWSGRAIAHTLISFGFDDGSHVVFSVEIRREKYETFSEIGGFFKEFELSIIAADERDIVRLRTNVRGEDAYLYRVSMAVPAMRSLFLAYVEEANSLVHVPRFYHTITVNCTTLLYHMMKRIVGRLPFDYRVLLSGYFPEYIYSVGGLDRRYPLKELKSLGYISDRAKQADRSDTFSKDIRRGVPAL
jgi:hypothetical protein